MSARMYLAIRDLLSFCHLEVVVPSTKSSRTTSICFALLWSCYFGSGRALDQVKPNHFHLFCIVNGLVILEVVVPSTKSSRTTSTCFVLLWSCILEVVVPSTKSSRITSTCLYC